MAVNTTALARTALIRELERLAAEVRTLLESLSEQELWARPVEPGNSVGHLTLHLIGNLNHFVGAQLGQTGYIREREREFTEAQPPPKAVLLTRLDEVVALFGRIVGGLSAEQLSSPHPESRFGSVLETLVHLVAHFALHRGQMSYIVRMVRPAE